MSNLALHAKHAGSRILHRYADWRIGATTAEKRCHKSTDSILLTFDDYGSADEVAEILATLRDKSVKAAFFLQGDWAHAHPKLVQRIAAHGHIVGNHTTTHPVLLGMELAAVQAEITGGLPGPWFRPPQGRYNKEIRKLAAELGYAICYWTIDSRDWAGTSVAMMRHTILGELHPGATILFHLHAKHTRTLLPGLIDDIRARGYQLTTPDETWQPSN
ncbi:MAG TPA: polysaccharide deacetylase family protein [Candidatus Saccharimonadales bacterium]|nr:polysaccharide deacetylase family protein [Candidatus Saccharimonadales bacterium]